MAAILSGGGELTTAPTGPLPQISVNHPMVVINGCHLLVVQLEYFPSFSIVCFFISTATYHGYYMLDKIILDHHWGVFTRALCGWYEETLWWSVWAFPLQPRNKTSRGYSGWSGDGPSRSETTEDHWCGKAINCDKRMNWAIAVNVKMLLRCCMGTKLLNYCTTITFCIKPIQKDFRSYLESYQ